MKELIVKLQTNGLYDRSILSLSYIKLNQDNTVYSYGERYYFPKEAYNTQAININKLNNEKITLLRNKSNTHYPKYFKDDTDFLNSLFSDIDTVISYNTDFEMDFITDFINVKNISTISLMEHNTDYGGITHIDSIDLKYPTFSETTQKHSITYNSKQATNFIYSVSKIYELYIKTLKQIEVNNIEYKEVS